jgi:hypothetical protein
MEGKPLILENAIGFSGKVASALLLHEGADAAHIIYSLGSTVVIRNVEDAADQTFLRGEPLHCARVALPACGLPTD